ncbi:hypothetical protein Acr_11g0009110 [Actinidia rufa]|uniref:Uncharacterized protein n=1 Tax=Actinidia rufa TaxID=165716 RepID=A0A7J0FD60_9ERIC|nr:hypothetical protein Acr_11g0009110 [Actinidia rufa]
MWRFGIYVALGGVVFGAGIAILAAFWVIQRRRKEEISGKMGDLELQQLGLSVRTTSEKVSFDHGSPGTLDGPIFVAKVELGLFQDATCW